MQSPGETLSRPSPAVEGEWLPPDIALDRYAPPDGTTALEREAEPEQKRYGFRVGTLGLLIAPQTGSETIPMPAIAPIPNSAHGLRGLINLRGALVPVFDLSRLLGLPEQAPGKNAAVLIFGKGDDAVGVVVDDHPAAVTGLSRMAQLPDLPAGLKEHVPAGYTHDGDVWLEFEHQGFFESAVAGFGQ